MIQGVLGCWLSLPNDRVGLDISLKVARRGHVTEDANVTVSRNGKGTPILELGSGYGWTGADPANIDEDELERLYSGVADTARILFPGAFEAGGGESGLRATRRFCVRPWTASNLGVFETLPARRGLCVVTGGNNTGGFAQAPVIAEAVVHAVTGKDHPMHSLYHPLRARDVLGAPGPGRQAGCG
jgi:glycine/D-amino acid oxidase-like deaminating enzyme